jgi:hypothetical protein
LSRFALDWGHKILSHAACIYFYRRTFLILFILAVKHDNFFSHTKLFFARPWNIRERERKILAFQIFALDLILLAKKNFHSKKFEREKLLQSWTWSMARCSSICVFQIIFCNKEMKKKTCCEKCVREGIYMTSEIFLRSIFHSTWGKTALRNNFHTHVNWTHVDVTFCGILLLKIKMFFIFL